jgi:dipeptidyl aminopeptidase/acylaminoacyl peptidase
MSGPCRAARRIAALTALAALALPASAGAWTGLNGYLAYGSNRTGSQFSDDVYVSPLDVETPLQLTSRRADDGQPAWSPDGKRLAFKTTQFGSNQLAVIDADGTNERRVTHNDLRDDWPSWSPDGSRLALSRGFNLFRPEIFVKPVSGGAVTKLTGTTLRFAGLFRSPTVPHSGRRFTVDLAVRPTLDRYADLICVAAIGKRLLPLEFGDVFRGRVRCQWIVPASARGKQIYVGVSAQVGGSEVVRTFAVRIR